jgi:hypothetical protein
MGGRKHLFRIESRLYSSCPSWNRSHLWSSRLPT